MMALFGGEILKNRPAALVFGHCRRARVELEAAALRRDRHAERVTSKHEPRRGAVDWRSLLARPAIVAGPIDLDDRARGRKPARRRNLFHQTFDVGAQKLRRSMALRADEMKMARVPVRRLVPRSTVAEIDLARDVGLDHPLERPVDGGASDTRFLPAHDVEQ